MKKGLLVFCFFWSLIGQGQGAIKNLNKGDFSLGVRSTISLFGKDNIPSYGSGGQFRIQLFEQLNSEWFADWTTIDLKGAGTRKNAHIGWSLFFYPTSLQQFSPYIIAGHCFDYVEVSPLSTPFVDRSSETINRWSSAIQVGLGSHYFFTERFNLSLSAQYMTHFGEHLNYEIQTLDNGSNYLEMQPANEPETDVEGHLLITLSLNYRIVDLW